jgi:hypothetical protein
MFTFNIRPRSVGFKRCYDFYQGGNFSWDMGNTNKDISLIREQNPLKKA